MKLIFRSNILPDFTVNTDGGKANSPLIRRILAWIRPAVYTTNTIIPVQVEPYGAPTPGRGSVNIWWLVLAVTVVVGLAVYGAWRLVRK